MNEHESKIGDCFDGVHDRREAALEAFDAAWAAGRRPRIKDFLRPGEQDSRLLAELAMRDLEHRFRASEPANAKEYFSTFPSLAAEVGVAVELIATEYRLTSATRTATTDALDEILRRYPEYADAVAARLATSDCKDAPGVDSTLATCAPEQDSLTSTLPHGQSVASACTLPAGRTVATGSRYRAVRFHARGGIGEVHVADDCELGREVALKRIQDHLADDHGMRGRFLREAQVTARLQHPGIVPVYGLVEDADGQPCYAMRFIEGQSFEQAIEKCHGINEASVAVNPGATSADFTSLEFRKLLGRFLDACNAIEYAHSRGVVHRDIKPANIMLGEYGETLVVDWGMAKVLEVKGEEFRSRELKKRTVFRAPRAPTAAIRPMQHGSVTFWERRNT